MTRVKEVIANNDYSVVAEAHFMKVMEDVEAGEEETRTPERIRNPSIEVEVI